MDNNEIIKENFNGEGETASAKAILYPAIISIIDKHLQKWVDEELNALPIEIYPEMSNPSEPMDNEGWQKWYPIDSSVSEAEIEKLEEELKFKLPISYKAFLKHKHFYEFYISDARFSGHEIKNWTRNFMAIAVETYPREFLIDKGYIPFADWSDWGLLCFDTKEAKANNEYPVVLWDHERWDEFENFSEDFSGLLSKLDKEADSIDC